MTTRADYTDDEWRLISEVPFMAGMAVMMAGKSGPIQLAQEMVAMSKFIAQTAEQGSPVEIVKLLVEDLKPKEQETVTTRQTTQINAKTPEETRRIALDQVRQGIAALSARAPSEELSGYQNWIMGIAQKVAEAGKEGSFLGLGGKWVSDEEVAVMNELRGALGLEGS
jgi:hypothetical protein